ACGGGTGGWKRSASASTSPRRRASIQSSTSCRLACACSWFIVSSFRLQERNGTAKSVLRGGARAPPPSRSALGRSHNGDPHTKEKSFEAAGLDRRAALYRQPGTERDGTRRPRACPSEVASSGDRAQRSLLRREPLAELLPARANLS